MAKKLRAAVWGMGLMGLRHLELLQEMGVEVALIVSPNEARIKKIASEYGVAHYSTETKALFEQDFDCVHLCSPPGLHYEQLSALLQKGQNLLCEKPLCFENEQAMELLRLARTKKVLHAIDFNLRFHDALQVAKRTIESNEFGQLRLVHGTYLQEFHAFPAPFDWRYAPKLAGYMRAMTEIGSHWTDLLQYLTGKNIVSLSARFANFAPERDLKDGLMYEAGTVPGAETVSVKSEDALSLSFMLEDGILGTALFSEVSPGRINRLALELTGSEKTICWESEANTALEIGEKGKGMRRLLYPFGNGFDDTLRKLFKVFYADIRRGWADEKPPYPSFYDGLRSVLICNAAFESANDAGRWVELPRFETLV